ATEALRATLPELAVGVRLAPVPHRVRRSLEALDRARFEVVDHVLRGRAAAAAVGDCGERLAQTRAIEARDASSSLDAQARGGEVLTNLGGDHRLGTGTPVLAIQGRAR